MSKIMLPPKNYVLKNIKKRRKPIGFQRFVTPERLELSTH